MNVVLNHFGSALGFTDGLRQLLRGSHYLALAVSYVQVGGWEFLRQQAPGISGQNIRLIFTDQLGITQPEAVRRALAAQANVRNYAGNCTYHPKVYLGYDRRGRPHRVLIGSANLSYSAFHNSVEAGLIGDDPAIVSTLSSWFDDLFTNRSTAVTATDLQAMQAVWQTAAPRRVRTRLTLRRMIVTPTPTVTPEDIEAIEDVLATVRTPLGLLNIDYARNNIRTIQALRRVIGQWTRVRSAQDGTSAKNRSETKLLGFTDPSRNLTPLGQQVVAARTDHEVALLWCRWIQQTADSTLASINPQLCIAKRVFRQFWSLKPEVRAFFFAKVPIAGRNDPAKGVLQTIELLCNATDVVQELSVQDFHTLEPMLKNTVTLPQFIRHSVAEYYDNKGTRGWESDDRKIVTRAWREAETGSPATE